VVGDGTPLVLPTAPLNADTQLVLRIETDPDTEVWPLVRELLIDLRLLPRADLAMAARRATVSAGESTDIQLTDSQPGVLYQLRIGTQPVGELLPGTGGDIVLPTGPITADTSFGIAAQRADLPAAVVVLAGVVAVALQTDPPPEEPPPRVSAAMPVEPAPESPGPAAPAGDG
jgi:hypothetical protein